jgi:hypothetical protein
MLKDNNKYKIYDLLSQLWKVICSMNLDNKQKNNKMHFEEK